MLSEKECKVFIKIIQLLLIILSAFQTPLVLMNYIKFIKTDLVIITFLNEGLPNVLLESLTYGITIISSDTGDCLDVLSKNPFMFLKLII